MRRELMWLWIVLMLAVTPALADDALTIAPVTEVVRPGRAMTIYFDAPYEGDADLFVLDSQGEEISVIVLGLDAQKGTNSVMWNGTRDGVPAKAGDWRLVVSMGDLEAETAVTIGEMAPYLSQVQASSSVLTPEEPVVVSWYAGCAGRLTLGLRTDTAWQQLTSWQVNEGNGSYSWDGAGMTDGDVTLTIQLTDASGESSTEEHIAVALRGFDEETEQTP